MTDPDGLPAFYTEDSGGFAPTGLGISPWRPDTQSGVSLSGLVAHVLQTVPAAVPMLTARLTVDILGAVPMERLVPVTRVLRDGKRFQLVQAELLAAGRVLIRGTALRMRTDASPVIRVPPSRPPPPVSGTLLPERWVEMVRLQGDYTVPGDGALWLRFTSTLIEGRPLQPLEAVAMAADFGASTAPLVPLDSWTFANVDIALHLAREPQGAWLLVDAVSESAGNGIGLTHARLGDEGGMIGMAHQTTFLNRR